ncbi:hypothetical protein DE146DRAFT_605398, partial [Phaeosphaeria sp. MPI-PUGE-AT-0046c]
THYPPHQSSHNIVVLCPYHTRILSSNPNAHTTNMTPMDRFFAIGAAEQSAMFIRDDTGYLSTKRDCTCQGTHNARL